MTTLSNNARLVFIAFRILGAQPRKPFTTSLEKLTTVTGAVDDEVTESALRELIQTVIRAKTDDSGGIVMGTCIDQYEFSDDGAFITVVLGQLYDLLPPTQSIRDPLPFRFA